MPEPTRTDDPATASVADPVSTVTADESATLVGRLPHTRRYILGDEIARGGMGEVYRASDTVLNREVAIKVLQSKFHPESSTARRFHDEARIAGQLQHPGIPAVHDLGTLPDGRPFLAMKLIKGDTLDDLLKHRPTPADDRGRFVAVFEQICHALSYAHAHGVIHRDLKPANIMVGAFGETQVMDWGLAKVLASRERERPEHTQDHDATADPDPTEIKSLRDCDDLRTKAGSILGTPAFMAPEQAIGAIEKINRRTDVFGLGAILAVILTGKPPFVGDSSESTRQLSAMGKVADCFTRLDASGAEPDLIALSKRCLSAEPVNRPSDAREVATKVATLRAAADDRARRAEIDRETATVQAAEGRKRRRVWAAMAVAVGLLAVGGGLVAWWADATRRDRESEKQRVANERVTEQAVAEATERQAITTALDQAEAALRAERYVDADSALIQVSQRMPATGLDDLRTLFGELNRSAKLVKSLDGLRHGWVTAAELNVNNLERGDLIVTTWREGGWDVDASDAEDFGRRMASSPIRSWLIAVFDTWTIDDHPGGRKRLDKWLAVARVADPHPLRNQLREAKARSEKMSGPLQESILALDPTEHSPDFLALALSNKYGQFEWRAGLQSLTNAAAIHPTHLRLQLELAEGFNNTPLPAEVKLAHWVAQYRAALALRPNSPPILATLAMAHKLRGDHAAAVSLMRRALAIAPVYPLYINLLGKCLLASGDVQGAIQNYEKQATSEDFRSMYAADYLAEVGQFYFDRGKWPKAVDFFRQALSVSSRPYNHPPWLLKIGQALDQMGSSEEAETAYEEGLSQQEKSIRDSPAATRQIDESNLGRYLIDRGLVYLRSNRHERSVEWMTRAVQHWQAFSKAWPQANSQSQLRTAYQNRAYSLGQLGKHADALPDWEKVLDLCTAAEKTWIRATRVNYLLQADKVAEALGEVAELRAQQWWGGVQLFDFARVYSVASSKVADMREEYANRAMELLHAAVKGGWSNVELMKIDQDLNPLRDRDEFKKLLTGVEKKFPPRKEVLPPPRADK